MKVQTEITINAPKEKVWAVITDIENASKTIQGIEKVEILNKPEKGVIGLKWKETRKMFGKEATEVMWITDAKANQFYQTRAESHGSIYKSKLAIEEKGAESILTMSFEGEAQSIGAKIMSGLMGWMMKGSMKKLLYKDLEDIKAKVEAEA